MFLLLFIYLKFFIKKNFKDVYFLTSFFSNFISVSINLLNEKQNSSFF